MEFKGSDDFYIQGYNRALEDCEKIANEVVTEIDDLLESWPINKFLIKLKFRLKLNPDNKECKL